MTATGTGAVSLVVRDLGKYWLIGDRLLPKISGGSEGEPGGNGEAGNQGESDAGGEGEAGESKEGEGESESGSGEGESKPEIERKPGEDRGAYRARRRAAEAEHRAEQAERELEELRDKDRSETERLATRASKAEKRVSTLETTVRDQAIQIAFLLASAGDGNRRKPINWVDAGDALALARKELDGIKVSDAGELDEDEVRSVVDDMAKRKSHLVRRIQQSQPSGANVGTGQTGPREQTADELAKTYGALRTRVPR